MGKAKATAKAGKGAKGKKGSAKGSSKASKKSLRLVTKPPKMKCCGSKSRCGRCPLRMLKEGTLPAGYTVKHRRLVRVDGRTFTKKDVAKAA